MLGVALALVAIEFSRHDDAALGRAARGTIHLERVNGLVHAVVMESPASICPSIGLQPNLSPKTLSANSASFRMLRGQGWSTPSPRRNLTNIEQLTGRIDQFVRFRTELARLGREESTAAARSVRRQ